MSGCKFKYVVATSMAEAESLAKEIGHDKYGDAMAHLKDVRKPPTDPYYAAKYKVFTVREK